jgi:hypothetical protein
MARALIAELTIANHLRAKRRADVVEQALQGGIIGRFVCRTAGRSNLGEPIQVARDDLFGGVGHIRSAHVLRSSATRAREALAKTMAAPPDGHCPGAVLGADPEKAHPDPNVVGAMVRKCMKRLGG